MEATIKQNLLNSYKTNNHIGQTVHKMQLVALLAKNSKSTTKNNNSFLFKKFEPLFVPTDEKGIEYFDMTDINTGKSYSVYGVPDHLLIPADNQDKLSDGFKSFVDNNYNGSKEG